MYSPSMYWAGGEEEGPLRLRVVYFFSRRWSSRRDWSLLRRPMAGGPSEGRRGLDRREVVKGCMILDRNRAGRMRGTA